MQIIKTLAGKVLQCAGTFAQFALPRVTICDMARAGRACPVVLHTTLYQVKQI